MVVGQVGTEVCTARSTCVHYHIVGLCNEQRRIAQGVHGGYAVMAGHAEQRGAFRIDAALGTVEPAVGCAVLHHDTRGVGLESGIGS